MKSTLDECRRDTAAAAFLCQPSTTEERFANRRLNRMPAFISHASLTEWVPCVVVDTSSAGARLEIIEIKAKGASSAAASRLPQRFTLTMPGDRAAVECEAVWKHGNAMGVRFVSPTRALPRTKSARVKKHKPQVKLLAMLGLGK